MQWGPGARTLTNKMSQRFKAIAFDFDGLIVDTEVPEYEAWLSIFRSYGVDLPLSVWTAAHRRTWFRHLRPS